jgi:hypothetical protein
LCDVFFWFFFFYYYIPVGLFCHELLNNISSKIVYLGSLRLAIFILGQLCKNIPDRLYVLTL